jgi:RHS repeat-associated protein
MSCDPTTNGFQFSENYVLGPGGEELTMFSVAGGATTWQRTNVYAAGRLLATYDITGLHFHLEDPVGTRRMQLSGNLASMGQPETDIQSLPFGDQLNSYPDQYAPATADDATPLHFTGKERDTELGNDYFGARYYASSMGRFMSPDWAAKASPVPYATFGDPQSLNLYAYMRNNPLGGADPDGHCDVGCQFSIVMGIMNGIRRDGGVGAYAKNVGTGILKGAGSAVVNTGKLAAAGTNPGAIAAAVLSPGPAALQPSNTTQAQASIATQIVLPAAAGMAAGPIIGAAAGAEAAGPTLTGFSSGETSMIQSSMGALQSAGYDTSPLSVLIRADMPSGYSAMSLSGSPTGAALGGGAFASQDMLNHTLEEELLHVNQNLQSQSFGPGDAAAKEAEVEAARKFPAPQ